MNKSDLFKLKNGSDSFYIISSDSEKGRLCIKELYLEGFVSSEEMSVEEDQIVSIQNPPSHWKAAFLVWKNSLLVEDSIQKDSSLKYKNKLIELLAEKYSIDLDSLTQLLNELNELDL